MTTDFISPATPTLRKISRVLCVLVFFIAILVLIGWTTGLEKLKRLIPDAIAVNPLTAVCFLLCSISLWLREGTELNENRLKYSIRIAWVIILISFAKFLSFIFSIEIYVDTILFHDQLFEPGRNEINRMAPNTSFCFFACRVIIVVA